MFWMTVRLLVRLLAWGLQGGDQRRAADAVGSSSATRLATALA